MRAAAAYRSGYAPYPANGYPIIDFLGAGTMAPRTGTGGGNPVQATPQSSAVSHLLPSAIAKSTPLAIIVVVAAGYLIWHISARV